MPSLWKLENFCLFLLHSPLANLLSLTSLGPNLELSIPHAWVACIALLASLAVVPTLVFFCFFRKWLYFGSEWLARDKLVFRMKKHNHVSSQILTGDFYNLDLGTEPLINMLLIVSFISSFFLFLLATKAWLTTSADTSKPYTGAMADTMHELQANLRSNKKFSPGRLKTQKGSLSKS